MKNNNEKNLKTKIAGKDIAGSKCDENKGIQKIDLVVLSKGKRKSNNVKRRITLKNHQWHYIKWKKAEGKIKNLQEEITIAIMKKDLKEVYRLQQILIASFEGQALAVRKVVTNKGGKTAGTDGSVWTSPQEHWNAIESLAKLVRDNRNFKADPVRRVYIPKANNPKEKRPLGIPTMIDRALQALYHLGVDPAVEAVSDPNSYGFRKCRSTQDAITSIRSKLDKETHPRWILEADIAKCFDKISHDFLMEKTPICHKHMLLSWLKARIMEEMNFFDTEEGTSQGGIMSPTLCNVALNGIEKLMREQIP